MNSESQSLIFGDIVLISKNWLKNAPVISAIRAQKIIVSFNMESWSIGAESKAVRSGGDGDVLAGEDGKREETKEGKFEHKR